MEKTLARPTNSMSLPSISFFRDRRRAFAALEYTNEKIKEAEDFLELLKWKKEQLEEYMKKEGYMY